MMMCFFSCSMASQVNASENMEDQLIYAVDHNNKAKMLGCTQQDPGLLLSLVENGDFLEDSDKIIRMFTTMKKAGVNLNYQDDDGDSVLHIVVETLVGDLFGIPIVTALINNIGRALTGQQYQDENDDEGIFGSESEIVIKIKKTQKFVKSLLKLGVNKKIKTYEDHETAADLLKSYIDEIGDEGADHKQMMREMKKLYKMLQ